MKQIAILFFLFSQYFTIAQTFVVLNGIVKDAQSGELLIGCNIFEVNEKVGVQSNTYGFYSLQLKKNDHLKLSFSYVGYKTQIIEFQSFTDTILNVFLTPENTLNEVEIIADKNKNIVSTQVSVLNIPIKQLASVPTFIGEKDLLKSLQLLPGIQFGQEGTSGLFIRGGSPDQNLILLDDVPMYNVSHLYGFFSIFNTDAIKNADVYKGGFPARHGGRLSSVIDIRTKDGNMSKWQGNAAIGVLSINGFIEGPIIRDKASIFISVRRSLLDLWTLPFSDVKADVGNSKNRWGYFFYDFNLKTNYIINKTNKLYLSVYNGQDKNFIQSALEDKTDSSTIKQTSKNDSGWGNTMASVRWNKILSNKLFGNFTTAYTQYKYKTGNFANTTIQNNIETKKTLSSYYYQSSIRDILIKQDFDYYFDNKNYFQFGASQSFKAFKPGVQISSINRDNPIDTLLSNPFIQTFNVAAYAQDEVELSKLLKVNVGLRYDLFKSKNYYAHYLQPRLSLRLLLTPTLSLKTSFCTVSQDLHLLTNSTAGLPTDLWLPATEGVKPERSKQVTFGIFKNFEKKKWETSLEAYYKTFNGVVEYKEGASFLNTFTGWEDKIETGKGDSYGIEFFLHKKVGNVNGWLSYTLSYNNRQFSNINNGVAFPFKFDRRHYLNVFINKILREGKRSFSFSFVFASGNPVTLPTDKYEAINNVVTKNTAFTNFYDQNFYPFDNQNLHYPQRNNYRIRPYNRIDLMYNYIKEKKWGTRTFSIGVYNALLYKNPYFLVVDINNYSQFGNSYRRKITIKEVSLFNFIPAISWSYKFK